MDTLDITREIRELRKMTVGQLRDKYAKVFGEENRSRNKDYLVRRIAWRIQANAYGGISERARLRIKELANEADLRVRFPRNESPEAKPDPKRTVSGSLHLGRDSRLPPPGTVLTREFKGETIAVEVGVDSFRWNDQDFKSLSAIAREVTGKSWNGFIFFRLGGDQ